MIASRAFLSPLPLAAIALLVVNDHVLKAAMPGVVTGKLSDLAGMLFFPLALCAAAEQLGARITWRTVATVAVATGLAFAAIKLSPLAGDAYRVGLATLQWPFRTLAALVTTGSVPALHRVQLTPDVTDLVVLPVLVVPVLLVRAQERPSRTASIQPSPNLVSGSR